MKRLVLACLTTAALLAGAGSAQAATCNFTWRGSTGGNWMTASNWNPSATPTENSSVCIESGSAVLEEGGADAPHLASLTIGGSAGLTVRIHQVLVSAATTIGPSASVTLNGTYDGANGGNASLGGGTVLNQGTITMEGTGYSATLYGTVTNRGTIDVPFGTVEFGQGGNGGLGSLTNEGAIDIAAPSAEYPHNPATLDVMGYPLDNASGTIANAGTMNVYGWEGVTSAFSQGNAPITGNTVNLGRGTSLAWTGSGAASFYVGNGIGAIPMSGNIAPGQNLTVAIGTGMEESGSFQNAGNITLNGDYPGCCGGAASIIIASGAMTNVGTITATSNDAPTQFIGSVVNDGTIVATPGTEMETTTGSFVNGAAGTLVPQISSSGFGSFTFDSGVAFTAGGALAPSLQGGFTPSLGQEFKVVAGQGVGGRFASVSSPWFADYSQSGAISADYGVNPNPPSPPAPKPGPGTIRVASVSGGRSTVTLKLSCPVGTTGCAAAAVRVTVTEHLKGGRLTALSARSKTKVVTIASGTVGSLAAGGSRTITLKLNRTGTGLVEHHHPLAVTVTVSEGGKTVGRATAHVLPPGKKKSKKGKK